MSKMKKMYLIPMLAVFGIALAIAGVYLVNHFEFQSDVYEPFEVQYVVLGDAGHYEGTPTCAEYTGTWTDYSTLPQPVDMGGLYAGEARKFCFKINNLGEGDVPYVVEAKVKEGLGNYEDCAVAFPETTLTGTALGSEETVGGQLVEVPADAPVVNDCIIQVSVSRGTLE